MSVDKLVICGSNIRQMILLDTDNNILKLKYEQVDDNINDIYLVRVVKYLEVIDAYFVEYYDDKKNTRVNGFIKGSNVNNIYKYVNYSDIFYKINKRHRLPVNHEKIGEKKNLFNNFLVGQVIKEGSNMKRDSLSTNIVLTRKFLTVHFFEEPCIGVAKQLKGEIRSVLRGYVVEILKELRLEHLHVIVKHTAKDFNYDDLRKDLLDIIRDWNKLVDKILNIDNKYNRIYKNFTFLENVILNAPIYDVREIVTDNVVLYKNLLRIMKKFYPYYIYKLFLFDQKKPLLTNFNIDNVLTQIALNKVYFLGKAYIVIDKTEAGTIIDVNSANVKMPKDVANYAYYINKYAVVTIVQQILIRNLSSLIIIDFIEMHDVYDREKITSELNLELRKYNIDCELSKMNEFCIIVISKKRKHMSTNELFFDKCNKCYGQGIVVNEKYAVYHAMLYIEKQLYIVKHKYINIELHNNVLSKLLTDYRKDIDMLEKKYNKKIVFSVLS